MTWPFDTLTPMKYGAILADPPWAYEMRSDKGHAKSPEAHYGTMSLKQIKALPISSCGRRGRTCLRRWR
jgi:N6-adenosine-specific RNA methylase IME4